MTWRITVKPTNHLLVAYIWTAQRSDGEGFIMGSVPLTTLAAAEAEAKVEVAVYEDRQALIADHTLVIEEFSPGGGE